MLNLRCREESVFCQRVMPSELGGNGDELCLRREKLVIDEDWANLTAEQQTEAQMIQGTTAPQYWSP